MQKFASLACARSLPTLLSVQLQGVDLTADVASYQWRAIGSNAAPSSDRL